MDTTLKSVAVLVIVTGLFLGVRYIGSVIHYTCLVPLEDCPPPFRGLGDLAFYATGGELNPLWRQ